eukprot:s1948_g27.t1
MEELYQELWDEKPITVPAYTQRLHRFGMKKSKIEEDISAMRALQSRRAGVSLVYLLSAEFTKLATERTGTEDPTFIDMKNGFWLSEDPIGREIICPRDGRAGCALVDWIPRDERREQTHFMSWTWKYSLQQVQSALNMFQSTASPTSDVFFFMCFFVNNQFRIIVEESSTGSDNLEDVFEGNLKRIGRMVAILDSWDQPVYLSRAWTVYEQFVASTMQIQVQFVLPKVATEQLQYQIGCGNEGIDRVIKSLRQVDSRRAKAWNLTDEIKVKSIIEDTVGFEHVDAHVTDVIITWIGHVLEHTCKQLLVKARANEPHQDFEAISDSEISLRCSL